MKAVFIFTREYSTRTKSYTEYRTYELGYAETGTFNMKAEDYAKWAIEQDPCSSPVIANLPVKPETHEDWVKVTQEINRRYAEQARVIEFLEKLRTPFEAPFNTNIESEE